jgi:uncharacterized protein YfaS (alpha-2-macroglobulin family)
VAGSEAVKKHRAPALYWWGEYGSELRDNAQAEYLIGHYQLVIPNHADLLNAVITRLSSPDARVWLSTQERLALFLTARQFDASEGDAWKGQLVAGSEVTEMGGTRSATAPVGASQLLSNLKFVNTGTTTVFLEVGMRAVPLKAPVPDRPWIVLHRQMLAADGSALDPGKPLKVGDGVVIHLVAQSHDFLSNTIVSDRLPAGLEIENSNIVQGEGLGSLTIGGVNPADAMNSPRITHVEFRDDRFVAAVPLAWWNEVHLFYRARVVTPGHYTVSGTYAEDMYRPEIFGVSDAPSDVTVVDTSAPPRPVKSDPSSADTPR